MIGTQRISSAFWFLTAAVVVAGATLAHAQRIESIPDELEGIGITEHLNDPLPLDLEFVDENGKTVTLGDYFDGERPVIVTLVYFRCPMLCTLVINGMVEGLLDLKWTVGEEFDIVTVSIDPLETPTLSKLKKQNYIKDYGRAEAMQGWHFLTGKEPNIKKLADTIGFGYRRVEETGEYAHAAGIFLSTPDGRLSRYLYGIYYDEQTLRLGLLEASEGKIGNTLDRFLMTCFHYDAEAGRYAPVAMNIMRLGGTATVVALGAVLLGFWLREMRRKRSGIEVLES